MATELPTLPDVIDLESAAVTVYLLTLPPNSGGVQLVDSAMTWSGLSTRRIRRPHLLLTTQPEYALLFLL